VPGKQRTEDAVATPIAGVGRIVTVTVTMKERQLALLEWFVVRARRLEEHSLAQDKDQLLTWASGTFTVSGVQGQQPTSVRWDLPPEDRSTPSRLAAARSSSRTTLSTGST
jgi:hypothetical protein